MYYELYVDVFFMVNFTMDAILLILLMKVYSDEDLAVLWQKRKES